MSKLKFFTDAHIAKAVVEQLRRRGIEVLRCEDVGMKHASDDALLEYATENGYVFLSMDVDVTRLDKEWKAAGKRHGGIFYGLMAQLQGEGESVQSCVTVLNMQR